MNQPSPAIVAQDAVRRLPRVALLLLCMAYVAAGLIGRDPWRNADMASFGYMVDIARGATTWLDPRLLSLQPETDGLLPYWIGAAVLQWGPAWFSPVLLARLPFALMLGLTLAATWYAVYHLAAHPRAQPVAFAFGGEANATDYARAIGDGGLLALVACLGLAQLSHEVTIHLAQLCFTALAFYAAATIGHRMLLPTLALALGLGGLVLSAAPSVAVLFGAGSALLQFLSADPGPGGRRRAARAAGMLALAALLAAALASALDLWHWRILLPQDAGSKDWRSLARLLLWFTWPAWPLALWTLWRWRFQIGMYPVNLHLALPLWFAAVTITATLTTKPADRALLLALPALATLAAFALPTLRRSVASLIDWFTLLFFTGCGIVIWVIWFAMQTGLPRQPAANVFKQAPDFQASFDPATFVIALTATMVWAWLVRWRVGRHQAVIWKSLVLPAGGAVWCWLLLMSLWMPLLDFVRSYRVVTDRVMSQISSGTCLQAGNLYRDQIAALRFHGGFRLEPASSSSTCVWLIADAAQLERADNQPDPSLWRRHAQIPRPSGKGNEFLLFRRVTR